MFAPMSPGDSTLVDLLASRARQVPERLALAFLDTEANPVDRATYGELDAHARRIAARIETLVRPGSRVLVLCPPGIAFVAGFFGCLYAGVIAVPAYPLATRRDLPRLQSIARDAAVTLVLTTRSLAPTAKALGSISSLAVEDCLACDVGDWDVSPLGRDAIAFLQYTSGSTATPKGVVITHRNAMANQRSVAGSFGHERGRTIMASWLPLYHDMGLGSVIQAFYSSGTMYLLSPLQFLQRPIAWLRAISRHRVTTSGGPTFGYDFCVKRIKADEREGLDLSTWDVAFNGAEPVRVEVMDRFAAAFAPYGFRREAFYPCYGLAESVVFVTGGKKLTQPAVREFDRAELEANRARPAADGARACVLVGCGSPWSSTGAEHAVAIVDPARLVRCPAGAVGEIWVKGPSVANGYWNQPDETDRTFHARLPDDEGPFLRTGDLGFIEDDNLFITGRLKDVIIIRGRKHHAEDIERTAEQSNATVRTGGGAAFGVERGGEERLVIVQEIRQADVAELDAEAKAADIREAVTHHHGVRVDIVVFAKAGTVPKTSSGKVRRSACRSSYLEGTLLPIAEVA
jgi:acyl-CoA synthetase (AMP-forming)/AMP-acid ligase II